MNMASKNLSPDQAYALLDILSHHEAYQELRDLRIPGAVAHSGPPFRTTGDKNELPLLHAMLSKLILPLPGLRDVSTDFYQAKCQEILEDFATADLSESYEAGYIGVRKTLATAAAAIIEAPARGLYGGYSKGSLSRENGIYDVENRGDVEAAFNDFLQGIVYGDLIDEMFSRAAETENLKEHDPMVQGAHEFMLVVLASFLHYIFIITPEGQTILTMIKRANTLVPYSAIRQTLKVGNAATMINGVMKIFLTKMTINSVTTFLGITNASDAGWNLLQTIISTVVNWDTNELKRRSAEIVKSSSGPSKAQRDLLKAYVSMGREEHDKCRMMSEAKEEPIVVTIMDEYDGDALQEEQIPSSLEYLCIQVSIADRKKITNILCSRQPDLLTQAVQEGVAAYDPVIRALHNAVDLSGTVGDLQLFLDDLLKFAPSSKSTFAPSVEDMAHLLRKHQGACHRFIHQVCKNGPELSKWYKDYAKSVAAKFRINSDENSDGSGGAGILTSELESTVSKLSEKQRNEVISECDAHAAYLRTFSLTRESDTASNNPSKDATKAQASLPSTREGSPQESKVASVKFLTRWQSYIDDTTISAVQLHGPVRHGGDADVVSAGRGTTKAAQVAAAENRKAETAPNCSRTVELLAVRFREILRNSGRGVS